MEQARILVIDDDDATITVLTEILRAAGFPQVRGTTQEREALDAFREFAPDLVVLDLHLQTPGGHCILQQILEHNSTGSYLPVLVITGDTDRETRRRALAAGAKDFLTKPLDPSEVVLRIRNLLETRFTHSALTQQNHLLEQRVWARTRDLESAQVEILAHLALAAEYRDDDTGHHTQRVGALAAAVAQQMNVAPAMVNLIRQAAPLHDVGKIGIPDHILLKAGPLSLEEMATMRRHSIIGAEILSGSRFDMLQVAERIARTHHERWDGTGYPHRLEGEAIPLEGRIVALADVFDALTHQRPYKNAWPVERAREELCQLSGTHFDPEVVSAFANLSSLPADPVLSDIYTLAENAPTAMVANA